MNQIIKQKVQDDRLFKQRDRSTPALLKYPQR